jgi:hypothetical protein
MKPTREQVEQWQDHVDGGKDDRLFTHTQDWLDEFAELAYQAGAEKGKADYEREHLRHAVPLPDALRVMQDQVAEACAVMLENGSFLSPESIVALAANGAAKAIRSGGWRKYHEGKS